MNIEKTLSVQKRDGSGKGASGRLRTQDLIPGVFYTAKGDNISVQAPALPLEKILPKPVVPRCSTSRLTTTARSPCIL